MKAIFRRIAAVVFLGLLLPVTQVNAQGSADTLAVARVWDENLCCVIGVLPEGAPLQVLEFGEEYLRIDCYDMIGMLPTAQAAQGDDGCYVNLQTEAEAATCTLWDWEAALALRSQITDTALAQLGTPYVYGGTGSSGFDCSGFVQYVFRANGVALSRVVTTQLAEGLIVSREALLPGDLVVFENTYDTGPSHIGIYLGQGDFVHASSSRGVTVSNLDEDYYAEHFLCGRRILAAQLRPHPTALPLISAAAVKNANLPLALPG